MPARRRGRRPGPLVRGDAGLSLFQCASSIQVRVHTVAPNELHLPVYSTPPLPMKIQRVPLAVEAVYVGPFAQLVGTRRDGSRVFQPRLLEVKA